MAPLPAARRRRTDHVYKRARILHPSSGAATREWPGNIAEAWRREEQMNSLAQLLASGSAALH